MKDGRPVVCYRIVNRKGAYAEILEYGAIVRALCVPDRTGALRDVVIGFDTLAAYRKYADGYFGACIGRYANRIAGASFTLGDRTYRLAANDGPNHLHGGTEGFSARLWQLRKENAQSVTLRLRSPDGDEGYPGNLTLDVTYTFDDSDTLTVRYEAVSDADTLWNPTNHSYFNLNGHGAGSVADHLLRICADRFTPCDGACIPLGTAEPVRGAMDLRQRTRIGDGLDREQSDPDLQAGHGYDHNYIPDGEPGTLRLCAELYAPESGIRMRTYSTMPGLQFYSGNAMPYMQGKDRAQYGRRCALCLETQFYPDAPHHADWPAALLPAGVRQTHETQYRFDTPQNIAVLDGYTLNPGDLSWDEIAEQGLTFSVYDRTAPQDILARAAQAEIVLTNKTVLTADVIAKLPSLRYVGLLSTGANAVDLDACRARGIAVTNVPGYSTEDVAQLTFALILELCTGAAFHSRRVHEGAWTASKDFCFWERPLWELCGMTLGIVGFGAIGSRVCEIARAFRMHVLVTSRTPKGPDELPDGVKWCSFYELLEQADIVTLHCPLTAENARMIGRDALRRMKPTAFLINTARGGLLDEEAVAAALRDGTLAGCAVDVLSTEPPAADNPLLHAENCLITPHIAWAAKEARVRLMETVAENLRSFLAGGTHNRLV